MAISFTLKSVRGPTFAAALGIAALSGIAAGPQARAAEPWPAEVQALYKIHFNGLEVGQFTFNSSVHNRTYTATGNADISALLGLVRWNGVTRVSGALAGDAPRPAGFAFDFKGGSKAGSIRMGFGNGIVKSVDLTPRVPEPPTTVPVQPAHMRGVLDPMSAVLALSRPRDGNPCHQQVSIFDGKSRFDLSLSFKEETPLAGSQASSAGENLRVCRVRIIPIAGHREEDTTQLRRMSGIEIAFRAIPSANLYVPHRITVPTFAGPIVLGAHSLQIRTQHEQIAFVN
jgi:hypothetical protein